MTTPTLHLAKCKRCGEPVSSMKKPERVSQQTFDRFSGICKNCFSQKDEIELSEAMKNDMFNAIAKGRIIT